MHVPVTWERNQPYDAIWKNQIASAGDLLLASDVPRYLAMMRESRRGIFLYPCIPLEQTPQESTQESPDNQQPGK
jgi:hypothetical protein